MSCSEIFSEEEQAIIEAQAEGMEISPKQWLRLAAMHYQRHIVLTTAGETCTYSGDAERAAKKLGTGPWGRDFTG